jgi:hypothetical protein
MSAARKSSGITRNGAKPIPTPYPAIAANFRDSYVSLLRSPGRTEVFFFFVCVETPYSSSLRNGVRVGVKPRNEQDCRLSPQSYFRKAGSKRQSASLPQAAGDSRCASIVPRCWTEDREYDHTYRQLSCRISCNSARQLPNSIINSCVRLHAY